MQRQARPGISSIVGTLFFVLIMLVSVAALVPMFTGLSSYQDSMNKLNVMTLQQQSTVLTFGGFEFGSPNNPVTVASGGGIAQDATSYSGERKVMFSSGLWWDFYSDGANIVCRTSIDGITWSGATTIENGANGDGGPNGPNFSFWLSGTTIYWASSPTPADGRNEFDWRYGTISSSGCGSITWTIGHTIIGIVNNAQGVISIETDSLGNTWVAITTNDGINYHIEVWEHASGAGAGVWTEQKDITLGTANVAEAIIEPWACGGTGCAVMIYGSATPTDVTSIISTTCTPTCATWTAPASPPSNYALGSSSAEVLGTTLYFAGLASALVGQVTGTLRFWSFSIGGTATSAETTIESSIDIWQAALDASSTTIVLFEANTTTNTVAYYSSVTYGATWSAKTTISTTETSVTGLTAAYSGAFVATWTSGAASPFSVRFAALSMLSIQNSSPFAVHMVSLYVYQPGTNALIVQCDVSGASPCTNAPFDYWIAAGSQMDIPFVFDTFNTFPWAVTTTYQLTATASNGVALIQTVTSPA